MVPEVYRLIAEYQEEQEDYKNKYLDLLSQVKSGKDAFGTVVDNWWREEREQFSNPEYFFDGENYLRGITEEEFEEKYDGDADKVPFDNLEDCNYKDLRRMAKLFYPAFEPSAEVLQDSKEDYEEPPPCEVNCKSHQVLIFVSCLSLFFSLRREKELQFPKSNLPQKSKSARKIKPSSPLSCASNVEP